MKMKTSELEGAALDWAVAKSQGVRIEFWAAAGYWIDADDPDGAEYSPSTDWSQGGPLIEFREVNVAKVLGINDTWMAKAVGCSRTCQGEAPLIAAMRAIVAAELGDEVDVPDELVGVV